MHYLPDLLNKNDWLEDRSWKYILAGSAHLC